MMRSRDSRGMTLIETLVVTAISLILVGALLGMLIQTASMARRSLAGESLWADAQSAARALESALRNYVPPEAIQNASPQADAFETDRLEFHALAPGRGNVERVIVENVPGDAGASIRVSRAEDSAPPRATVFGGEDDQAMRLEFRFAFEYNGLDPVWTDQPIVGRRPRLVEYRVSGHDERYDLNAVLEGVVAPGA